MHASGWVTLRVDWIQKSREHALIILSGIALTCVAAFLYLFQPLLLSTLDLKIYDTLLKSRPGHTASDNVVIVDIDTKSLAQYGQWPWPRYRVAQLLDKLREMGALSVGVDILFAEPDRSSLRNVQKNILADFNYTVSLSGIPRRYIDNDTQLAEALKKGPFVLGYQFLFGEHEAKRCTLHPINVLLKEEQEAQDSVNGFSKRLLLTAYISPSRRRLQPQVLSTLNPITTELFAEFPS
jgi:CHASE2 domain-containing sensor protein